jgi:beta-ring hydroxylase|tara:strand:+ start:2728 stop:3819 length:1092 start_codon:yes stop_codon:yes gene_type:complete
MARVSAAPAALDHQAVATALAAALVLLTVAHWLVQAVLRVLKSLLKWHRQAFVLRPAPMAPGYLPLIGHTVALFKAVGNYPCTWDLFSLWATETAPKPVRVQIFTKHCVVIGDPSTMKRVMSTNAGNYAKDTGFSYAPFLEILGTGLVTSDGDQWRTMRGHISKALRVDILDEIIAIANRAAHRLCAKLDKHKVSGEKIDMENEFRLLTLQVIGEAVLSLQPAESDTLFPALYLPIMDECNTRSLSPWRAWALASPEWWRHKKRVKQLDGAIIAIVRQRWRTRCERSKDAAVPDDILERVLEKVTEKEYGKETEKQLCFEIKTFLLAGHETSAAMLTWTLHELSMSTGKVRVVLSAVRFVRLD